MKVIVTSCPSYEPIDQVRRLTNFSTGELGVHLSNQLTRAGFEVFCLKGSGATHPGPGEPATKVIAKMRHLFPESILVGWKYELAGTPPQALAKAVRQMQENRTDACVLNGQAYGSGFAFCRPTQPIHECRNKTELVQVLTTWLPLTLRRPVACVR
jgi:hypothetical protein